MSRHPPPSLLLQCLLTLSLIFATQWQLAIAWPDGAPCVWAAYESLNPLEAVEHQGGLQVNILMSMYSKTTQLCYTCAAMNQLHNSICSSRLHPSTSISAATATTIVFPLIVCSPYRSAPNCVTSVFAVTIRANNSKLPFKGFAMQAFFVEGTRAGQR